MNKKHLIAAAGLAMATTAMPAQAQYYYVGQILDVGFNYCPQGTFEAAGQVLPIAQYQALFSLYGTYYGGDGQTNFQLPDLRGRNSFDQGQGSGQPAYVQGQTGGTTTAQLTLNNLPSHSHNARIRASSGAPNTPNPADANFATFGTNEFTSGNDNTPMADDSVQLTPVGGGQAFNIQNPFLTLRYCVVNNGIYPSRN